MSYFKIEDIKPVDSYNPYIVENIDIVKSQIISINSDNIEIETQSVRFGGIYELTISATLKDHHATDPVILNLIG